MNWPNTSLFIIPGAHPTLKLPIRSHPSSQKLFFSVVVLVLNYHGWKGAGIKLIQYYILDITYNNVKPSHLKKM